MSRTKAQAPAQESIPAPAQENEVQAPPQEQAPAGILDQCKAAFEGNAWMLQVIEGMREDGGRMQFLVQLVDMVQGSSKAASKGTRTKAHASEDEADLREMLMLRREVYQRALNLKKQFGPLDPRVIDAYAQDKHTEAQYILACTARGIAPHK